MRIAMLGLRGIPATYGGVEDFTEQVSVRLARRGHEVTVYCRSHYSPGKGEYYRGVRLVRHACLNTKHLEALSHTLTASLDSLRRDFDIIHYHALGPSAFSFIPRFGSGAKVVATIHSLDWRRQKWNALAKALLRLAEYPAVRFPDRVTVVSNELKEYFERKYGRLVERIPVGVPEPRVRAPNRIKRWGLGRGDFVLFVGRLVPEKGCHLLVEAIRKLDTTKKFFVAGGGSHSDKYAEFLKEIAGDRVVFGGHVDDETLEELFSNAYLFVQSSYVEGMPQSLIRALSYGLCSVYSDIPANVEAAAGSGFSFATGDASALADRLARLLADADAVRSEGAKAAEALSGGYSWDNVVAVLEGVYEDLLADTCRFRTVDDFKPTG